MKKIFVFAATTVLTASFSYADLATFDAAQGWVDGDVLPGAQPTQTSGLAWLGNQASAYMVNATAGTLDVTSAFFLRQTFSLAGAPMDIPTGGSITLDANVSLVGNGSFAEFRRLLDIALTNPTDPLNPTTGNASWGVQFWSDSEAGNWWIDAGPFGNDGRVDTGIAVTSPLAISMVYSETSATDVSLQVFLNGSGTSSFDATFGAGAMNINTLYGWSNATQGTGATPAGILEFDSIGLPLVVPEPSTITLALIGLAGLVARRRFR